MTSYNIIFNFIKEFSVSSRIKFYFKYYYSRFRLCVTHQVIVSKILEISVLKTRLNPSI